MRKLAVKETLSRFASAPVDLLRLAGRRRPLPCPARFSWVLENPYTEAVAGSRTLLDRLDLRPGMRLLDAGCGPGRLTLPAADRVGPQGLVVAMDIQEEMLGKMAVRAAARGLTNIRPVHGGLGGGLLEPGFFDRALLVTVLGEIPDKEAALSEIHRSLKAGGVLSITELLPDPHYQPRGRVRRLAEDTGYRLKESHGSGFAFTLNFEKPG